MSTSTIDKTPEQLAMERIERVIKGRDARIAEAHGARHDIEQTRQRLRADSERSLALWDLDAFPSADITGEHDGRSHLDDLDNDEPYAMAAVEVSPGPGDWTTDTWWLMARALNRSEFLHTIEKAWCHRVWFEHPALGGRWVASDLSDDKPESIEGAELVHAWVVDRGTPSELRYGPHAYQSAKRELDRRNKAAHLESRNGDGPPSHVDYFKRFPVEFPHVLSRHDRDGGDVGTAAIHVPTLPGYWVVRWERRHLSDTNPRHMRTWLRLKHAGGKGPKLRRGSYVYSPEAYVSASTPDEAIDAAWQWASEMDLDADDLGYGGAASSEASEEEVG